MESEIKSRDALNPKMKFLFYFLAFFKSSKAVKRCQNVIIFLYWQLMLKLSKKEGGFGSLPDVFGNHVIDESIIQDES